MLDLAKMKEIDFILLVRPEFHLAREFVLAQPELTCIFRQSLEMHNSLPIGISRLHSQPCPSGGSEIAHETSLVHAGLQRWLPAASG
jgi:hypothetical protein